MVNLLGLVVDLNGEHAGVPQRHPEITVGVGVHGRKAGTAGRHYREVLNSSTWPVAGSTRAILSASSSGPPRRAVRLATARPPGAGRPARRPWRLGDGSRWNSTNCRGSIPWTSPCWRRSPRSIRRPDCQRHALLLRRPRRAQTSAAGEGEEIPFSVVGVEAQPSVLGPSGDLQSMPCSHRSRRLPRHEGSSACAGRARGPDLGELQRARIEAGRPCRRARPPRRIAGGIHGNSIMGLACIMIGEIVGHRAAMQRLALTNEVGNRLLGS